MIETKEIIIESGRDEGKKFKITEMNAFEAEKFFIRAGKMISRSLGKSEISQDIEEDSSLGKSLISLIGNIEDTELDSLMDKLMRQVTFIDEEGKPRKLESAGIKDFTTLLTLKKEALALHFSFLPQDHPLTSLYHSLTEMVRTIKSQDI